MENIEIGEYVRTKRGEIHKVIEIKKNIYITNFDNDYFYYIYDNDTIGFQCHMIRHSKQLINLIEPGDIVNGKEVLDIYKPRDLWEPIEIKVDSRYENSILADEIKTILTKEQYKNDCYKVGGEYE